MSTGSTHNVAFTLIELSLVLVIIGLIVGGVLVGRDLIVSAGVRAQISQFGQYKAAFNTFRGKYDCLPGDCANASSYGLGNNGNGNGVLEQVALCYGNYTTPDCAYDGEFPLFFIHLAAAKLIAGGSDGSTVLGKGYPRLAINDQVGMIAAGQWQTGATGTTPQYLVDNFGIPAGFWLYAQMCINNLGPGTSNDGCGVMTPSQASAIDSKMDDGNAVSGQLWTWASSFSDCTVSPSYTAYNLTSNLTHCQMGYRLY